MLKENRTVVAKRMPKPQMKNTSAIFSIRFAFLNVPFIDKKDRTQQSINNKVAEVVNSSIRVRWFAFSNFIDVRTTKHKPSKLEEALSICGDL